MKIVGKLNGGRRSTVAEGVNTKDLTFVKASDMIGVYNPPIVLKGYMISTKSKYGESITLVTESSGINIPKRYVELFKDMADEEVDAFVNGKVGISEIKTLDTDNGSTVKIIFCDL